MVNSLNKENIQGLSGVLRYYFKLFSYTIVILCNFVENEPFIVGLISMIIFRKFNLTILVVINDKVEITMKQISNDLI